ncbi:MAG: hypothetical protein KF901_04305 [Myxococcales bacterium]|nr:hypothetical protein [Myxococcales bacterium]
MNDMVARSVVRTAVSILCVSLAMLGGRALAQEAPRDDDIEAPLAPGDIPAPPTPDDAPLPAAPTGDDPSALGLPAPSTAPSLTDVTTLQPTHDDDDEVWARYHEAALALAADDRDEAIALLLAVSARSDHPAAALAERLLRRLGHREQLPTRSGELRRPLARAELAAWQTAGGAALGVLTCALAECDDVRIWTLAILGGAAIGAGLSLGLSRDGVTPGQASLYASALRWGYLDTWLLSSVLGLTWRTVDDPFDGRRLEYTNGHIAALLIGQFVGLGGAFLIDRLVGPTAGDVGLVDSLHNLSSATLFLTFAAANLLNFNTQSDATRVLLPVLLGNVAALGLGAWLTTKVRMSRARALLLDVGMGLGAGLGMGIPALARGDDVRRGALFGGGAIGVVGGFIGTWLLTRKLDDDDRDVAPPVQLSIAPAMGGAYANLAVRLR